MAKFDPRSYRVYLMNSKYKHILVEGKDDKYLVERLYQDFLAETGKHTENQIHVDSADDFIKGDELIPFSNNRQKVKYIANSVIGKPYSGKFIGFVDRELDEFEWDYEYHSELKDIINTHDIIKRLILSRGHSIENYIFDISILCDVLESLSSITYTNQVIHNFRETFESTLRIACSVGLAASKAQVLQKADSTIDYSLLEIASSTEVAFEFEEWVKKLVDKGISTTQEQNLRLNYIAYNEQVAKASMSLVKWICPGHIGFDFIKALYERCVLDMCPSTKDKNKERSGITWASKKLLYTCINYWVKKSPQNQDDYPRVISELLGL